MNSCTQKRLRKNIRIFYKNSQEVHCKFFRDKYGEPEKRCSKCRLFLPWYDFAKIRRGDHFNLAAWCKECVSLAQEKKKTTERRRGSTHRRRTRNGLVEWRCNGCREYKDACDFSLRRVGGEMIPRTHCRKCRSEYDRARTLAKNRI